MAKVNNMFTTTLVACPIDRTSSKHISLSTNQHKETQDQAKAATYV